MSQRYPNILNNTLENVEMFSADEIVKYIKDGIVTSEPPKRRS
jgi:hypothetical protein